MGSVHGDSLSRRLPRNSSYSRHRTARVRVTNDTGVESRNVISRKAGLFFSSAFSERVSQVLSGLANNSLELQLENFRDSQILVAGEALPDRYVFGETDRISPEAPIPVLHVRGHEERPHNATFVRANLSSLGAAPSLLSVIGGDHADGRLRKLLARSGVRTDALVEDRSRPAILKERLIVSVQYDTLSAVLQRTYGRLWVVHSKLAGNSVEPVIEKLKRKYPVVLRSEFRGVSIIFCAEDGAVKDYGSMIDRFAQRGPYLVGAE
jgi:hypothetical protein